MNKIHRQHATVDTYGQHIGSVTLKVTGAWLEEASFLFVLPRDAERREPLTTTEGGQWKGKNVNLVVHRDDRPGSSGFKVGFEVNGELVFSKPITLRTTANPPQRIPAPQRAAPQPAAGQSKAPLGYSQAGSTFGKDTVTVRVTSPFVLEVQCRGETRELVLKNLEFGKPFRLEGIGNVTVRDFRFKNSLWNVTRRVNDPGAVHDFSLEVFAAGAKHMFWLCNNGATVDGLQPHEAALLLFETAAQGDVGDDLVREIAQFSQRRQHSHRPQNRPQGPGQHNHRPAQHERPQPPRNAPPTSAGTPAASPKPTPPRSAPPSPNSDGPTNGDGQGAEVRLQLPPNSTAVISVKVSDNGGAKPSVTAAAIVCEHPSTSASAPPVIEDRGTAPAPSAPAEVMLEPARQPVAVVEELPTDAQANVDPNSPMGKFLARQAKTRQFQDANRRAAAAKPDNQGQVKPKGMSLDELARQLQ